MAIEHIDSIKLPTWALCYIVNNDSSGISDEDQEQVDEWIKETFPDHIGLIFDQSEEGEFFTHSPPFGLACNCIQADVYGVRRPADYKGFNG